MVGLNLPPFAYRKLGDFTYHLLSDPIEIRNHLLKWSLLEWESDHREAPHEHWTVEWLELLPKMEFSLEILRLENICPRANLMSVPEFQASLQERAGEREDAMQRGVSLAPLLVNAQGFELMDGYTRYTVLQRYHQQEIYAYLGQVR